jgi:hypothetical protein
VIPKPSGAKGYEFEEILRNYFLKANFYVLRALPLKIEGEDLTDIDIWLYERPSGFARRRLIVDAKFKMRPKAAERLFWTRGVSELLRVDGAYVATTDSRPAVRKIAHRLGLAVFDGTDLNRIASSNKLETPERLTEEELASQIQAIDQARLSREWALQLEDAKSSLLEDFGVASGNRCLNAFNFFAEQVAVRHPNSPQAAVAVRAAFLTASMAVVSLDYVSNEAAFRTGEERKQMLTNAIRFGNVDREAGLEKVRLAAALVSQFAENGAALGRQIFNRYSDEVSKIPAEIVSDHVARMSHRETLFLVARELEAAAYSRGLGGFDSLSGDAKGLVAALLDFCGIARNKFASAFTASQVKSRTASETVNVFPSAELATSRSSIPKETEAPLFDPSIVPPTATGRRASKKTRRSKRK